MSQNTYELYYETFADEYRATIKYSHVKYTSGENNCHSNVVSQLVGTL